MRNYILALITLGMFTQVKAQTSTEIIPYIIDALAFPYSTILLKAEYYKSFLVDSSAIIKIQKLLGNS